MVEETPGVRAKPSNSGFLVLQQALEDLSGSSLASLARDRVFGTLGMTASAFEPVDESFLTGAVTNHGRDGAPIDDAFRSRFDARAWSARSVVRAVERHE